MYNRSDKTAAEIEEERLAKFVSKPAGARGSPVSINKQVQQQESQPQPQTPQKQWSYKQNQSNPKIATPKPTTTTQEETQPQTPQKQWSYKQNQSNPKIATPKPTTTQEDTHKPPQKQWAYQQKQENTGVSLSVLGGADMDLSTRINYLNNLYDQGTINDKEYGERAAALKVVAAMVEACISGNTEEMESLVSNNPHIDLNIIKENGSTILHLATESIMTDNASPKLLEILLSHGVDIHALRRGQTVLHSICDRASHHNALESVRYLTKYNADVNQAPVLKEGEDTRNSIRALGLALESNGSPEIIRILLEAGASPNTLTNDGPALNYCIINQKKEEAKLLLEYRADPNSRENNQGATCLASAIASADAEMVKLLVKKGVDRNAHIMNGQQATPAQLIESMKDSESDFVLQVEHLFQ